MLCASGALLFAGGAVAASTQPAAAAGYYQCAKFQNAAGATTTACSGKDNGNHAGGSAWIKAYIAAHAGWSVNGKPFYKDKKPCGEYTCWNPATKAHAHG
ncbi:MAG TPA: hypothetical protein VGC72_18205 [Candidatus Elarobacter sp.]|jgi:hypothetical protein